MFLASEPFLLFDSFRVPYRIADAAERRQDEGTLSGMGLVRAVRDDAPGKALYYWKPSQVGHSASAQGRRFLKGRPSSLTSSVSRTRGRVSRPPGSRGLRRRSSWTNVAVRLLPSGATAAETRSCPLTRICSIEAYWSESYRIVSERHLPSPKRLAMQAYYRARPLIPRGLQIALRRGFSRIQARTRFRLAGRDCAPRSLRFLARALSRMWPARRFPHLRPGRRARVGRFA